MKTTLIKKLSALALSVFTLVGYSQCPTVTGFNVTQGSTATTTIVPVMSGIVNPSQTMYYWQVTPAATVISGTHQSTGLINFPGNGTYTVCLQYNDSTNMCTGTTCTLVTITTSTVSTNCNAAFTNYQDSSCITHFVNSSTGSNLTYQWYDMSSFSLLSTLQNPALNLGAGNHFIGLYVYASGQFCDSTTASINVSCSGSGPASCNAAFSFSNDSNCVTHFTNTSTGSNLTYEWRNLSAGFSLLSTQQNPNLSLGQGSHQIALYVYSAGQFCDSTNASIYVSCSTGTSTACNALFNAYVDSFCVTHLYNYSSGSNLTYQWYDMSGFSLLSTQQNPSLNLAPGVHAIGLYVYSSGQFCDSMSSTVNVNCSGGGTLGSCHANSQFSVFADSTHAGNYFAYNQSSGTGTLSYLWNFGDGSTSTQAYPFHQYASSGHYVICLTVTATSGTMSCSDMYCDSSSVHRIASGYSMSAFQVLAHATGVKEQQAAATLNVYPNPVENELTIDMQLSQNEQPISYVLTDALGKTVSKNTLMSSKTIINTSNLDKGIYFLSVFENNKILKTTKLVK